MYPLIASLYAAILTSISVSGVIMRAGKRGNRAPCGSDLGFTAWREELLSCAFEADVGISRLMAAVRIGPPKSPSPKKKRQPRRSR